jgi:F-type H+-transporting ATPase subunit b
LSDPNKREDNINQAAENINKVVKSMIYSVPFLRIFLCLAMLIAFASSTYAKSDDHGPDPTSAHAGANLDSLIDLKTDKTIWSAVVFGLLFGGLYFFAWKPISQGLALREQTIATQIAEAKRSADEAMAKLKEYDAKLQTAHAQAADLITQARKDAESAGQRIVAESQAEASRQRDRALADIESAKQGALSDIAGKSTDIAFSLARRVVGRELRSEDHKQLIADSLNKMPSQN